MGPPSTDRGALPRPGRWFRRLAPLLLLPQLGAGAPQFYADNFPTHPTARALASLGQRLFFDTSLSASGRLACSSCHDPTHAFAAPNTRSVQLGGADGHTPGVRAVPTLMYAQNVPPFSEHYVDDEGDDSVDQGPAGGRTWDGRAESAHDQARLPLLSPFEMANADLASVLRRLSGGASAEQFRSTFGAKIFDTPQLAFNALLQALESFQQDPALFYPYTSKYDAFLRGQAVLGDAEARGLAIFNDPQRGNCARCHPSARRAGAFPQFTDFGFAALGVPRNPAIAANRKAGYYDLGLCGPYREDLRDRAEYCGLFRTPTLRNVALRAVFFHNGEARTLREAVRFYGQRDADPTLRVLGDLPTKYRGNLDRQAPFKADGQHVSATLGEAEIDDLVAFLRTLSDGFSPPAH